MVSSNEELEAYLTKLERRWEHTPDNTYLVGVTSDSPVALRLAPPVLVVHAEIGDVPTADSATEIKVLRRLLELNRSDLLHAAYGVEGNRIVLGSALELSNLDLNELEAVLSDMDLAMSEHVPVLRELVGVKA